MGAGKSTVGARLARSLGRHFVDLDKELEAAFAHPIDAIFERFGEESFRAMESRLLVQALCRADRVVALGGGTVVDEANRCLLQAQASWVHLEVPLSVLKQRLDSSDGWRGRPLAADEGAFDALYESRQPLYAQAAQKVDGDGGPAEVAAAVEALCSGEEPGEPSVAQAVVPRTVEVAVPGDAYEVVIGEHCLDGLAARLVDQGVKQLALLTDWNVGALHGDRVAGGLEAAGIDVRVLTLPAGEEHKTAAPVLDAVEKLLDAGWHRHAPVLALGGGVLGDMAGLVASMVLRGVPFVQVPTTLLAMVDSSVGGKVGVNHRSGKNLIGAFHQPSLVWVDLAFLSSLPDREFRAGLAEAVKVGLLGDPELFELLESRSEAVLAREPQVVAEVVERCCRLKAEIVAQDATEKGTRMLLNLGHTLGHALESALGFGTLLHGEAVAIGMVAAAELGTVFGMTEPGLPARLREVLQRLGLPTSAPPNHAEKVAAALPHDKKRRDDSLTWVIPASVGKAERAVRPMDELDNWLAVFRRIAVI